MLPNFVGSKRIRKPKRLLSYPVVVALSAIITIIVVYTLNTERTLYPIAYAFSLFGTLIHEMFHIIFAYATGGFATGFVINASTGGYALIVGGNPDFVLPAGYMGCAIFGAGMLYLVNRYRRLTDFSAALIGIVVIVFTILYGRPEENGALTTFIVGIAFGSVLFIVGASGWVAISLTLVNIVASMTTLHGLFGAWAIFQYSEYWHHNDAVSMSQNHPIFSANAWALIWAVFSVLCFAAAVYYGPIRTMKGKHKHDMDW